MITEVVVVELQQFWMQCQTEICLTLGPASPGRPGVPGSPCKGKKIRSPPSVKDLHFQVG